MSKKNRRRSQAPAPTQAPTPVAAAPASDPFEAYAGRTFEHYFLPDEEPHVVDENALLALVNDWRHGRATRTIGQALGDAYYVLFTVILLGAMVTNVVFKAIGAAECTTDACTLSRQLVPWAALFAFAGVTVSIARLFGPVLASAPEGSWLMEAPISRSRLLRGRFVKGIVIVFVLVAGLNALIAALAGMTGVALVGWGLAAGFTATALWTLSAADQPRERTWPGRVWQAIFTLLAAVALGSMVALTAGWASWTPPAWLPQAPWAVAAVFALVTVVMAVVAHGRLGGIRRARLLSGGSLVSGMQGAMFGLDLGLARDILVEREAVARGHVKPTRGRGLGEATLMWRDLQRLRRFPRPLIGLVGAVLVPYATDALGLGAMTPFIAGLALFLALVPFLGSLRVLTRTKGLARTLPLTNGQIRSATIIVPGVLAGLAGLATLPAVLGIAGAERTIVDALLVCAVIALAGLLGAVRWQTARPVDFNSPMVATASGAVSPTLIFNLFRGFDVVALITAPVLLGAGPIWSFAIAIVVFSILRAGKSMADLQEEAEQQKKELEELKAQESERKKIKVQRPQR